MADSLLAYASVRKSEPAGAEGHGSALRTAASLVAIGALALLTRPYLGLGRDARLYVGRAVANLDPNGVGRDLMFAKDGQSDFSLFPPLFTQLVATLGPSIASALVALVALALWVTAAAMMVRALVGAERSFIVLGAVLVLPAMYAWPLGYGEALAIPRPFAEALGLLSLRARLRGRGAHAWMLGLAAAALHPIMALPVLGVLGVERCRDDARWWLVGLAAALAVGVGSFLGLPLLGRLLQPVDPAWMRVLRWRNGYLFVDQWAPAAWSRIGVQGVTLALAARGLEPRARRLATTVLALSAVALVVTAVFAGGLWRSLLLVQLQPWRTLWLLAFLAAASLPIVALELWRRGGGERLAAAALVLAWLAMLDPGLAATACLLALGLVATQGRRAALTAPILACGWVAVLGAAAALIAVQTWGAWVAWSATPPSARASLHAYALVDIYRVLEAVVSGVAVLASAKRARAGAGLVFVASVLALGLGAAAWDGRNASRRNLDDQGLAARVRAIVARRPGLVEWLDGDLEPAQLAGRPAWQSELQGAGLVFSRDQALEWARRTRRLVADGLAPSSLLLPFGGDVQPSVWTPTRVAVQRFCAEPDAPAWVVAPLASAISTAQRRAGQAWLPAERPELMFLGPAASPTLIAGRAFIPCGG